MKGKADAMKEIERLQESKNYGKSRIQQLEEERREKEMAEEKHNRRKIRNDEDDDNFIDNREEDPELAKRLNKIKRTERNGDVEEDFEEAEDEIIEKNVGYTGSLVSMLKNVTPSAPKAKKISEKEDLKTKQIMEDLFETMKTPEPVIRYIPQVAQAQLNNEVLAPRIQEELNHQVLQQEVDIDLELEALEAEHAQQSSVKPTRGMDIETPQPKFGPSQNINKPITPTHSQQYVEKLSPDFYKSLYSLQAYNYTANKQSPFDFRAQVQDPEQDYKAESIYTDQNVGYFYYIDIHEDPKKKSKLYLYGKLKLKGEKDKYASCCISVNNMERCYYFIKRANEDITLEQVLDEVTKKIEKRHPALSKHIKVKMEKNKYYAFELDIARDQVEAVRIRYSFDLPPLEIDFEGNTYNGILGRTYKPAELFVIKNRVMGPGWLEVHNFRVPNTKESSNCQIEISVESMGDLQTTKAIQEVPKFKAISVSLLRDREGDNGIKALVALYTPDYDIESVQTTVKTTPMAFVVLDDKVKSKRDSFKSAFGESVAFFPREFAMINGFLQKVGRIDPDLIIGHDANNVFYEVLLSRIEILKIDQASNLGRCRRDQAEMRRALKGFGLKKVRQATFGRMIVDTHLSSLEVIRETNYEIDYLAEKLLNIKNTCFFRAASQDPVKSLIHVVDQCIMDAHLALSLNQKLQLVQLNKQLTNVSGCFWYQSFQNLRADRNELLLMHSFDRSGFLFPDKYERKYDGEKKNANKREKAKYSGGLVLEPKSGLYQDYVLLLDFNSLYPSIIREFKICFTSVRRDYVGIEFYEPKEGQPKQKDKEDDNDDEEEVNQEELLANTSNIPDHDPNGIQENSHNLILPKIITTLIKKRQEVKKEIKEAQDKQTKETLDIKQKAYKLIANSIYGCLGFKNSRFYAKQMAALITYFGRNILQASSEKVGLAGFEVVYGDTDSLMINSKEKSLSEAIAKGREIKKLINDQYKRNRILEIELDGIFKSLLLLKKKKYAADKLQNLDEVVKAVESQKIENVEKSVAKFEIELKGLDIVRRDWSGITKQAGQHLIDLILSSNIDSDDIPKKVYEYLESLKVQLDKNEVTMDKFTIYKQLNKNPNQYSDKGQPHVQVAKKMMSKGFGAEQLIHHFIPYIITEGDASLSFAERANHPDDVRANKLKPDIKWYVNNQLINPIVRLLEYLPGIDMDLVAEKLGIDKTKLNQTVENKEEAGAGQGTSILYNSEDKIGSLITWICPKGHKNTLMHGAENAQCSHKNEDGSFCYQPIRSSTLKNIAIQNTAKLMKEYNNNLFAFNRRAGDNGPAFPCLPIYKTEITPEQETAVSTAVTQINTRLYNIVQVFDNSTSNRDKELSEVFNDIHKKIKNLRDYSSYEKIEFGNLCAPPPKNRIANRHYLVIAKNRN